MDEVYPRPRMIVGKNREMPYKGHTMPDSVSFDQSSVICSHAPINPNVDPYLPIKERSLDKFPLKGVVLRYTRTVDGCIRCTLVLQSVNDKRSFFFGQEPCCLWEVVQREVRQDCNEDGQNPLENENPSRQELVFVFGRIEVLSCVA